jgi:ABC-type glutathione transport system ATPase component
MTHAAEREPLLVVDDLRTSFHLGGRSINAVNGVSFTLDRGATLGIVGESGSGKSVMARAVMGSARGQRRCHHRIGSLQRN